MTITRVLAGALALLCAPLTLGLSQGARADEPMVLRYTTAGPLTSLLYIRGFQPWVKEVQEDSGGAIEIKTIPGLASAPQMYDSVINNVTDIGSGTYGPISSDFQRTLVVTLPFENRDTYEATLALWRLIEKGPIAPEYSRVKPLVVFAFPDTRLHTKKPIKTMEDIKGMKFTASTRVVNQTMLLLGAVPISMPPNDIYQSMSRGVVDGTAIAWTAVYPYKLDEVSTYHYETALGMEPGFYFMNKAAYAKLPEKAQTAIHKRANEPLARRIADVVRVMETEGRERVRAMAGHTLAEMDPAEAARWRERIAPVVDEWVKRTPNGAEVLAAYRAEIAKIRAEPRS
jgi:TRAP-type C4-dicarboxylate transport system substrate-binding protein